MEVLNYIGLHLLNIKCGNKTGLKKRNIKIPRYTPLTLLTLLTWFTLLNIVDMVYAFDMVYTVDMVYTAGTYTMYNVHCA